MTDEELTIVEHGEGAAVLLLHGTPTDPVHMRSLALRLGRRRRVLVASLPGYGSSWRSPYSWEEVHERLARSLVRRDIRELAVVGYSSGAWRAVRLARDPRFDVTALASLGGKLHWNDERRKSHVELAELVRNGTFLASMLSGQMFARGFGERFPSAAREVEGWMDLIGRERVAEEVEAWARSPDMLAEVERLRCPVLARVGAEDVLAPPAESAAIASAAPRGELQTVPGVGHGILFEDPEGTADAIEAFLDHRGR